MGTLHGKKNSSESLSDEAYVNVIDKLREFGIAGLVSLPQLVVVGDQSSGKSSVLESLTGFAFPRAPGLCTRYATQITCRRDDIQNVHISIIPRPDSNQDRITRLKTFQHVLDCDKIEEDGQALADVFEQANRAMGIRGSTKPGKDDGELTTFSEDILKIEISGPSQQHLTVIDVPGIFRTATQDLTTEDDIALVRNMVKKYINEQRTIILAVIPCNVDIATQEVLKLAAESDPEGNRTMAVLTKPDLAPERATQQAICELIQGRKQPLRLGYYIVKNRGADDQDSDDESGRASILSRRHSAEKAFFSAAPWSNLKSTKRVGIEALKSALRILLRKQSKKEFKNVALDVEKLLESTKAKLWKLGDARNDTNSQRRFLGRLGTEFQQHTQRARENQFNTDIFANRNDLRLANRIVKLCEDFADCLWHQGHRRVFDEQTQNNLPKYVPASFMSNAAEFPELHGILKHSDYRCPVPSTDSLMAHIQQKYNHSRGMELGTFSNAITIEVFKEQSQKWEMLAHSYTSKAIVIVHSFIIGLLKEICPDAEVREQLWANLLRDKVCDAYRRAMAHADFLIFIERHGEPVTFNHYFNSNLQINRAERLQALANKKQETIQDPRTNVVRVMLPKDAVLACVKDKSNAEHAREDIHDILKSYYKVARKRFVDIICQQVIYHFLLDKDNSPIHIFCPELIMGLDDAHLETIAGEDPVSHSQREQWVSEVENLEKATRALRFGGK